MKLFIIFFIRFTQLGCEQKRIMRTHDYHTAELTKATSLVDLNRLLQRGGFPEPYFSDSDQDAKLWQIQYTKSILSTDIFEDLQVEWVYNAGVQYISNSYSPLRSMQQVFYSGNS